MTYRVYGVHKHTQRLGFMAQFATEQVAESYKADMQQRCKSHENFIVCAESIDSAIVWHGF